MACGLANGLVTVATCGRSETAASVRATWRRFEGSVSGRLLWKTIWSRSPDTAGKRLFSRSLARCAPVFGSVKLSLKWFLRRDAAAKEATNITSHRAMTVVRCVADQRASDSIGDSSLGGLTRT